MAQTNDTVKELMQLKGIKKLWPAQEKAIQQGLLRSTENFVIIAPTSGGKTFAAELAIFQALKRGMRVLYLLPMQAMISEKTREFSYLAPQYSVSDLSKRDKADIIVATFEAFYRTTLLNPSAARAFGLAIVDEFHVLYDKLRGFNLEKAITLLKLHGIRIVCLSATFEDKSEVAGWLSAKLVEIPEEMRKVKLQQRVLDCSGKGDPMDALYKELVDKSLKPYLIFCNTKDSARARAVEFSKRFARAGERGKITDIFSEKLGRNQFTQLEHDLLECVEKGVGFHHSCLDSELKSFVEEEFRSGRLRYLFATTGLAYGVNFPAKTVVVCDLAFWDVERHRQVDVPVYLYIQMAGRAGRPQFGREGYVIIVAKTKADTERAQIYLKGTLERASSRINDDDLFRKAVLELIYAGQTTDEQIRTFFDGTFFNYQGRAIKDGLGLFDLGNILKRHADYIQTAGFVTYMGAPGFKLTDLGQITLEFLFRTYGQYQLTPFQELDRYLAQTKEVKGNFDIIYKLTQDFPETHLARTGKEKARGISEFFEKKGVDRQGVPEHTAYAIYWGWMQNFPEEIIEKDFNVYASQIRDAANELFKLLEVYEALGRKRNLTVPLAFELLKDRLKHGVREEEVPFVKLSGIERDTVRGLWEFSRDTLSAPPFELKGTLLEKLVQHYEKFGEDVTLSLLSGKVKHIGNVRARKIVDLVKSKASNK